LAGVALFLDFDGTLVELAETPDAIRVSPELPKLLARLGDRLDGRLAIISGRAIGDLERYLSCRGLAVSGSHGLELRLSDGSLVPLAAPRGLDQARERVGRFAEALPGILIEDKPFSIAVHYRRAPEREAHVRAFMDGLAAATGLVVQQGKMVTELRPAGADKGDAVRAFMAEPPFAGARPLFVGDDLTDEDAFRACGRAWRRRRAGGNVARHRRQLAARRCRRRGRLAVPAGRRMSDLNLWPIGNCQVSALVDSAAGLVWACAPQVDGDPLFCSLLSPVGGEGRGEWRIEVEDQVRVEQNYLRNTSVWFTRLVDEHGGVAEI
jgi:trehalose 6-phosphate phosphatase